MKLKISLPVIASVALVAALASAARAEPEFLDTFRKTYDVRAGSKLALAECRTCHTSPPDLNPYGLDVRAAKGRNDEVTIDDLLKIEVNDPDKDGSPSGTEIRAGTLPGDPKSFPGAPPEPLVPLHSYHPALVHFPIALFFVGALLDAFGAWKRRDPLRDAGRLNLIIGAIASIPAASLGLVALYRQGLPFQGLVLNHFAYACLSVFLLVVVAVWRGLQSPRVPAYWVVLALTAASLILTGEFGAAVAGR